MSERPDSSRSGIAIGAVVLLGAAFLWEVLSLTGIPIARDMQLFFIPQRHLLWTSLQTGHLPLWTPFLGNGAPLLANFQSGAFYPPNWVYAVSPFFEAFNGLLVLHFVLGGVFMYLFGRAADFGRSSAGAAAIGYMLGGYFVSLTNLLNVLQAAAWAPAVCWAILLHAKSRSARSFALLVAVLWLAFIAGEPLTFALAVALGGGYGIVRCRRGRSRRGALILIVSLAVAGTLIGGLAAMQVLPTAEFVSESDRAGGLSYEESERYHLEPVRLIHLAVPPEYGDPVYRFGRKAMLVTVEPWLFSVYLGAVVLVLIAAARLDRDRRLESVYWAAVGALGLILSLGDATPLYGFLYRHLPGFASFRFPERFLFLTGFAAAMLAATGLSALRAVRRPVRLDGVLGIGTLATVTGIPIAWSVYAEPLRVWGEEHLPEAPFFQNFAFAHAMWAGNLWRIAVLVAMALLVITLYRRGIFRESLLVALLLGLLTLDLWTAHRQLTPVADRSFFEQAPVLASLVPFEALRTDYRYRASPFDEDITRFHTLPGLSLESEKWTWQQTVQPNLGALHGILTHDSGDAIHLSRGVDQSTFLAMLPDESRWRVLRLASVRWVYSFHGFERDLYGSRTRLDSLPGFVYELRDPLPRAYLAEEAVLVDEEIEAFNASITREFDPRRQVALLAAEAAKAGLLPERARVGAPDDGGDPAYQPAAEIVADEGTEIRISVSPTVAGYLVLTDSDYPGWSAHVDGEERPILLANYFYRAVPVRPGDREVVFTYRSRPFELGRLVSAATLVTLLIGFGLVPVMRRRMPAGSRGGLPAE
jgi:hypothetical protein